MLLFEIRPQERLGEPHAGRRFDFRLAAIEGRSGKIERAEQHGGEERKQYERDRKLDEREAPLQVRMPSPRLTADCSRRAAASTATRRAPCPVGGKAHFGGDTVDARRRRFARTLQFGGVSGVAYGSTLVCQRNRVRLGALIGSFAQRRCVGGDREACFGDQQRAAPFIGGRCVVERAAEQSEQRRSDERDNDECHQHFEERESARRSGERMRNGGSSASHSRIATRPVSQSTSTSYLRSPEATVMRPPLLPPSG